MPAVVADQRRQRVPVNPDHARGRHCAAGAAPRPAQSGQDDRDECFMGGMLQSCARSFARFRGMEPASAMHFAPHFPKYRMFMWSSAAKVLWTMGFARSYLFHNAGMTESCGVELGPLPLPVSGGLGEGTKLRLVKSLDLRGWALLGAAALCIALPGVVTTLGGSARAGCHARRTQTADAVQLGRVPAELPGLGQRGRHRDRGQPEGFRRIRARARARRRHHRAGFQRRFGQ